jgi:hypothetical protein
VKDVDQRRADLSDGFPDGCLPSNSRRICFIRTNLGNDVVDGEEDHNNGNNKKQIPIWATDSY